MQTDDTPKVDCHECKDLEFARNLARQMKEGYGRHNSNRAFRDAPLRPILHIREALGARVIDRVGDLAIRERWEDCEVGDAVTVEQIHNRVGPIPHYVNTINLLRPIGPMPVTYVEGDEFSMNAQCEQAVFERVAVHMRPTHRGIGPMQVVTEHLWKRLS